MIRIRTFGGLAVLGDDDRPLAGAAAQPRRMALLALLARCGERGMSREKLLQLLWPDADDERGPRNLAQALYALRRDLGSEEAIAGTKALVLDPGLVTSDVSAFAAAVARAEDETAATLYAGPFLDAFHLADSEEFTRWVERERATLAHDYARCLESLARAALAGGNAPQAVAWWRRLAGLDPLNARVTVGLMESLTAAGDRAGAIRQAQIYEALLAQELDLPPDGEVLALAERLRQGIEAPRAMVAQERVTAPVHEAPTPEAVPPPSATAIAAPPVATRRRPRSRRIALVSLAGLVVLAGAIVLTARWRRRSTKSPGAADAPLVAVGRIASFGEDSSVRALAAPVSDLLATSMARVPGLRVVSPARMLELMHAAGASADTGAAAFVEAARRAGATVIIDGTLYARAGGRVRLDLRRVDLATGAIGDVRTIEGTDVFALVDSGTASLVTSLGRRSPAGSVADVTTSSLPALRMYEDGIRAYYLGDMRTALGFFDAALAEDTSFALAAWYGSRAAAAAGADGYVGRLERARRLAARATDRERLIITAGWANGVSSPSLRAIAETLVVRYPVEVEGYLYSGIALVTDGDFSASIAPLERAITMDSLGFRGNGASCGICEAFRWLVSAYELSDALPAAERVARRWVHLQPDSRTAVTALVEVMDWEGRGSAADSAFRSVVPRDPFYGGAIDFRAMHLIRYAEYDTADALLRAETQGTGASRRAEAWYQLAISLRQQGRLREALEAARQLRRYAVLSVPRSTSPPAAAVIEAQLRLEMGEAAAAAALFDSLAQIREAGDEPSQVARRGVWMLAQAGGARLAAGDTAALERLVEPVRTLGRASGLGRDRRLFHHLEGLVLAARGDTTGAITEFRNAIYSTTAGFTRTNAELARLLAGERRFREAIAVLQPALRGSLEASNLYVSRTALNELLAQAWDSAGGRDSAVAHYAFVARSWQGGDAPFVQVARDARARMLALGAR